MSPDIDSSGCTWELDIDWPVMTEDGKRLGNVEGVHLYQIIVSTTHPSYTMLFVPVEAITNIESDTVHLSVTFADVCSKNWALVPEDNTSPIV